MEQEFGLIPALGSEEAHYQTLVKQGDPYAEKKLSVGLTKPIKVYWFTSLMRTNDCLEFEPPFG